MRIVSSQQPLVGSPKSKSLFSRLLINNSELKTKQVGCIKYFAFLFVLIAACSCNRNQSKTKEPTVFKGLYSFGPEIKSFKDCDSGREFWVTDSSAQLELQYSQLNFEKPYEPVYVEVEGIKSKSGKEGMGSEYDSTLVVKKVIKITKEIPQDICN